MSTEKIDECNSMVSNRLVDRCNQSLEICASEFQNLTTHVEALRSQLIETTKEYEFLRSWLVTARLNIIILKSEFGDLTGLYKILLECGWVNEFVIYASKEELLQVKFIQTLNEYEKLKNNLDQARRELFTLKSALSKLEKMRERESVIYSVKEKSLRMRFINKIVEIERLSGKLKSAYEELVSLNSQYNFSMQHYRKLLENSTAQKFFRYAECLENNQELAVEENAPSKVLQCDSEDDGNDSSPQNHNLVEALPQVYVILECNDVPNFLTNETQRSSPAEKSPLLSASRQKPDVVVSLDGIETDFSKKSTLPPVDSLKHKSDAAVDNFSVERENCSSKKTEKNDSSNREKSLLTDSVEISTPPHSTEETSTRCNEKVDLLKYKQKIICDEPEKIDNFQSEKSSSSNPTEITTQSHPTAKIAPDHSNSEQEIRDQAQKIDNFQGEESSSNNLTEMFTQAQPHFAERSTLDLRLRNGTNIPCSQNKTTNEHPYSLGVENCYHCSLCGHEFLTRYGLHLHSRSVHGTKKTSRCRSNRRFRCRKCGKKYATEENMLFHAMLHESRKECAYCFKKFKTDDGIKRHELMAHEINGKFVCKKCRKTFSSRKVFVSHKKVHARKDSPTKILIRFE